MIADFPRILTLLRKEKKINQKTAAAELGVSQALLSHYEKGIRECGLEFVVRAANYYGVSADYLLGISPNRDGLTISIDELPEKDPAVKDNILRGSLMPVLNKKLIANSLNIIFDMLQKCENKAVCTAVSDYLMLAVYKVFRGLYSLSPDNDKNFFQFDNKVAQSEALAKMIVAEAMVLNKKGDYSLINPDCFNATTESLMNDYPMFFPSLSGLIKECEKKISD